MKALDGGRINIASCSLGGAALALDVTKDYMSVRS
jgi:isobutyryl-CoA dehydrogenase